MVTGLPHTLYSSQPSGVYFVKIESQGKSTTFTVIKQGFFIKN
jgi:hypothetical protein